MKRIFISLLLVTALVISCVACSASSETASQENSSSATNVSSEVSESPDANLEEDTEEDSSEEDLVQAVALIKEAEELVRSMSSTQLDYWSISYDILLSYFVDEEYMNADTEQRLERAEQLHEDRTTATEKMSEAKSLMGTTGSGDFYEAVKEYYLLVNDYLSLVSTDPKGYSELTMQSTVSELNFDCQSTYNRLEFNYLD